ncbi:MAG: LysE family transporter [Bacillota bacterium]
MDITSLFLTAFIVALTGAMMPGPLLTVTVAESVRRGFWAGPLLIIGHGVLEAGLVGALALGLGPVISRPNVVAVIALVGGGFLLWMGVTIVRDVLAGRATLTLEPTRKRDGPGGTPADRAGAVNKMVFTAGAGQLTGREMGRLVGLGVAVSFSNPYWSLWWATIGIKYISDALPLGFTGLTVFYTGHILADLAWYAAVAAAIIGGRRVFSPAGYRLVLALAGFFLIGLAGYFIVSGWRFW